MSFEIMVGVMIGAGATLVGALARSGPWFVNGPGEYVVAFMARTGLWQAEEPSRAVITGPCPGCGDAIFAYEGQEEKARRKHGRGCPVIRRAGR